MVSVDHKIDWSQTNVVISMIAEKFKFSVLKTNKPKTKSSLSSYKPITAVFKNTKLLPTTIKSRLHAYITNMSDIEKQRKKKRR